MDDLRRQIALRDEALARVRQILIERLHVPLTAEEIDLDAPLFGTGLGLDSVDAVELVVALETELSIRIPEEAAGPRMFRTVQSLVELVLDPPRAPEPTEDGDVAGAELPPELDAIRNRVAWSRGGAIVALALRGDDARAALLHLAPSRLHLRDAQVRESLLLDDEGRPIADVLVCADDEDYFLLVEGLDERALIAHVQAHLPSGLAPIVEPLSAQYEVISVDGPWAWELVAEALGSDLVALPYLSFFRIDQGYCIRAGKTGEYGYELLVRRELAAEVAQRLESAGEGFGLVHAGEAARSLCRFESWFFDPAHVPEGVTPIELGLSWRLDASRSWVGKAAVEARRAATPRRLIGVVSAAPLAKGDTVSLGDRAIGEIVRAARSPLRGEWIASALIDREWAHGGIDRYEVRGARVRTVAPPLVDNRSLYVDPRRHSWRTADEVVFPPLVRGPRAPA